LVPLTGLIRAVIERRVGLYLRENVYFVKHSAADRLLRTKLASINGEGTKLIFAAGNRCDLQNLPGKKNVQIKQLTKTKANNKGTQMEMCCFLSVLVPKALTE
jgi:hypothetical protein